MGDCRLFTFNCLEESISSICSRQLTTAPNKLGQHVRLVRGESLHHVADPVPKPAVPCRRRSPVTGSHRPDTLLRPCDARENMKRKLSDAATRKHRARHDWCAEQRPRTRGRGHHPSIPTDQHLEKLIIFPNWLSPSQRASQDH